MGITVSKGQMRAYKIRVERLSRAVPTLDLRRKQLNHEILAWEDEYLRVKQDYEEVVDRMESNPHPEIQNIVGVERVEMKTVNVAGVIIEEVEKVVFRGVQYSLFATPPSFDIFIELQRAMLEKKEVLEAKGRALEVLNEELAVTTQRINLFEKRLIPECRDRIRYIQGRLEDNERSTVIVAKIAQAEMLSLQDKFESA